ncbi:hypothetical protein MBRA1_000229 [Malassezia brasiliensis]|uniref:Uncharacterized protein n=1 Tax=Malassezia brasiliensis TaxID=1821822 RepID=A0AAF0DQI7_9BASI|nr:hypothetical protein MBRA1_000229 [Malassezia brasiliensis]
MAEYDEEPLLGTPARADGVHTLHVEEAPPPRRYLYAPISYEQATAPRRPWWHPLRWHAAWQEHAHVFDVLRPSAKVRTALSRVRWFLRAAWPHNRMHQTILIVFALWIVVSYVSFSVDELLPAGPVDDRIYSGYAQILMDELADVHPAPAPGDGVVTQNATWAHEYCYSRGKPLRLFDAVGCKTATSFTIDAVPNKNSMISTDTSFLYIDRLRRVPDADAASKDRRDGPLPARPAPAQVYVRAQDPHGPLAGQHKIEVNITATFFRPARVLFDHTLVAKVERGHGTQGIEIRSPSVSEHAHLESEPLQFDVTISVPPETVAGLEIDAPNADVQLFTELAQASTNDPAHLSDDVRGVFALLLGDARPSSDKAPAPPVPLPAEHLFGHLDVQTDVGEIVAASNVRTRSLLRLATRRGDLTVRGTLTSPKLQLDTDSGRIAYVRPGTSYASSSSELTTQTGDIVLDEGTHVSGVHSRASSASGAIAGSGTWHANLSLALTTGPGILNASVAVHHPLLQNVEYSDYLASDHGRRVENTFVSHNGSVSVWYVAHQAGVPLRTSATSAGNVTMRLAPTYEGPLSARGRRADITHAPFPAGRHWDAATRGREGGLDVVNATTYWDDAARPPLAPPTDAQPLLEAGKSVLSYGPQATLTSHDASAQLIVT